MPAAGPELPDIDNEPRSMQLRQYDALVESGEPLYSALESPGAVERPWLLAALYAAQLDRTRGSYPMERLWLPLHRDVARTVLRRMTFAVPPDVDGYTLDAPDLSTSAEPGEFRHEVYSRPQPDFEDTTYWERAIRDVGGKPKRVDSMRRWRGKEWTIGFEPPDCDVFQLRTLLDTMHPDYEKDSVRPQSRNHRLRVRLDMLAPEISPRSRDRHRAREAVYRYVDSYFPDHSPWRGLREGNYLAAAESLLLQHIGWRDFANLNDPLDAQREQRFMAAVAHGTRGSWKLLPEEVSQMYKLCLARQSQRRIGKRPRLHNTLQRHLLKTDNRV